MNRIFRILMGFILLNILFSLFVYSWARDEDIGELPSKPLDRFSTIFHMNISTFTLTGSNKPIKSKRAQILMSLYMLIVFATVVSMG